MSEVSVALQVDPLPTGNLRLPLVIWRDGPERLVLVERGAELGLVVELRSLDAMQERGWRTAPPEQAVHVLERYALRERGRNTPDLEQVEVLIELLDAVVDRVRLLAAGAARDRTADVDDLSRAAEQLGAARSLFHAAGMRGGWL